jgi:hypothetical protein
MGDEAPHLDFHDDFYLSPKLFVYSILHHYPAATLEFPSSNLRLRPVIIASLFMR